MRRRYQTFFNGWVLPSPSGLNANHQLADLVELLMELRRWVDEQPSQFPAKVKPQ